MLRVGLLGATGYMGAPICSALLNASKKRQLDLIILHSPSSELSKYPQEVEKRAVDLDGEVSRIREAVKGLNVVISAISGRAQDRQYPLLEALQNNPDLITFFPSEWATPFTEEDQQSPFLRSMQAKAKLVERAKELGVPTTVVKNATTPELLFGWPGMSSFDPKGNKLELYTPTARGKRGLTSKVFSGEAVVHLLLNRLHDLPNQTFSLVELEYSSDDLISTFTKLHEGKKPTIQEYTEEDYQHDLKSGGGLMGAMKAGRMKGLAVGCTWPGEKVQGFEGWGKRSLEDYIKDYM